MDITVNFKIVKWEEEAYSEIEDAGKLTCASVSYQYSGALEASSEVRYIMSYDAQGRAVYRGLERISGELQGKAGSFVLLHQGVFADGKIDQQSTILENSGTGELRGISGSASLQTGHEDSYSMRISYQLAAE